MIFPFKEKRFFPSKRKGFSPQREKVFHVNICVLVCDCYLRLIILVDNYSGPTVPRLLEIKLTNHSHRPVVKSLNFMKIF